MHQVRSSVGDNVTLITSILSFWTTIINWKESILPLLSYGQTITSQDSKVLLRQIFGKDAGGDEVDA
jgi:hypothetical protein